MAVSREEDDMSHGKQLHIVARRLVCLMALALVSPGVAFAGPAGDGAEEGGGREDGEAAKQRMERPPCPVLLCLI